MASEPAARASEGNERPRKHPCRHSRTTIRLIHYVNAPAPQPLLFHPPRRDNELAARLRGAVAGEVLFDAASRGRYATDASIYQIEPVGVLVPRTTDDVRSA